MFSVFNMKLTRTYDNAKMYKALIKKSSQSETATF